MELDEVQDRLYQIISEQIQPLIDESCCDSHRLDNIMYACLMILQTNSDTFHEGLGMVTDLQHRYNSMYNLFFEEATDQQIRDIINSCFKKKPNTDTDETEND